MDSCSREGTRLATFEDTYPRMQWAPLLHLAFGLARWCQRLARSVRHRGPPPGAPMPPGIPTLM